LSSVPKLSLDVSADAGFQRGKGASLGDRIKETVSLHSDRLRANFFDCPRMLIQYNCKLPSILEAVPPSANCGREMPWPQGPTYQGLCT